MENTAELAKKEKHSKEKQALINVNQMIADIEALKLENAEFRNYLNSLAPEFEKSMNGIVAGVTELDRRFEIIRWDNLIMTNLLIIIHGIILQKFPALKSDPYYGKLEMLMQALQSDELQFKQTAIEKL